MLFGFSPIHPTIVYRLTLRAVVANFPLAGSDAAVGFLNPSTEVNLTANAGTVVLFSLDRQ